MKRTFSMILCLAACAMVAACGAPSPVGVGNSVASAGGGDSGLATAAVAGVAGYALAKATQPSAQPYPIQTAYAPQRTRYVPVYVTRRQGPTPAGATAHTKASASRFSFRPASSSIFRSSYRSSSFRTSFRR